MEKLEGMGMEPNGKLGQAGEAMGRAGRRPRQGRSRTRSRQSGLRPRALRQGAQALSQQLARQGPGGGGMRAGDQFPNEDPLGRPQRTTGPDLGTTVKVPDEIDIQRARGNPRRIRKRLGDPGRALMERDYLERLLDRFSDPARPPPPRRALFAQSSTTPTKGNSRKAWATSMP